MSGYTPRKGGKHALAENRSKQLVATGWVRALTPLRHSSFADLYRMLGALGAPRKLALTRYHGSGGPILKDCWTRPAGREKLLTIEIIAVVSKISMPAAVRFCKEHDGALEIVDSMLRISADVSYADVRHMLKQLKAERKSTED